MQRKKKGMKTAKDYAITEKTTCKKQVAVMQIKKDRIVFSENGVSFLSLSAF
ncbi:hypothetical protein ACRN85_001196 [Enterobacter hormaechei]|uniref:hypothetical protein n=1 Tax=Enterobacter hormaechei TaxID=158836 RepID=UPI0012555C7F|nr:hypothetical protein [Enterobacter hormaechei]VAE99692.1 Uncharacterised protein [Enterobacter hormaechei]HCT4793594.1 hypothetical protein [Enterobacter hormaechei]